MSVDGACLTYYIFVGMHIRHSTFCLLSLHFPVYGRVHDHASVDYPGIYHRSILRYGYRPVSKSTAVSLVTPPSILCGDALITLLALLYAHIWHTVPLMSLLCENAISGISVSLGYVLSELECVVSSSCYCLQCEYRPYVPYRNAQQAPRHVANW